MIFKTNLLINFVQIVENFYRKSGNLRKQN